MAPKGSTAAKPAAKKASAAPEHPPYKEMIKESILALKERNGSSRPALKKYIQANYKGVATDRFDGLFNQALKKGAEAKEFAFPKGPSGTVKLVKKEPAPKVKPAAASTTKKATTTTTKKPAATKAATTKTATTKKVAPKKTAAAKPKASATAAKKATATVAKPKANAKKSRKATAAPAVVDKSPVLTKTKSGRVSKGSVPIKAAPKKKAPITKKKATPKKKETAVEA